MKPLFFPFTHVSEEDAAALLTCFNGFCRLGVSRLEELTPQEPAAEVVLPSDKEIGSVFAMIEDYRQWARVNQGGAGQLKARVPDIPYFTSDTGISSLKSTIESQAGDGVGQDLDGGDKQRNALLNALVFLRMAQEADGEIDQIDKKFSLISKSEARLFSALRGNGLPSAVDVASSDSSPVVNKDRGCSRTDKRILSWACFFREKIAFSTDTEPLLPVTTSSAVMDYFLSMAKKSTKVLDIGNFKVHERSCDQSNPWKRHLNDVIWDAVSGIHRDENRLIEASDGCAVIVDVQLHLFSDKAVTDIFCPPGQKGRKNRLIQGKGGEIPICLVHVKNKNA
ncbi:hypothetical protein HRM2_26730 [Desulforapulum autotrophicum HRM2]|uniref:Uncharacterized protein n=1 Tax=Desulforapulum autotrophicum (strain ATCC 43914 / DSM 3382 / VKM B-1955 / HRM2) TaxID=177437 RepID=C0QI31_DESAH|nr:hypothetical protein [Desulforapulum autotrophicum]ACN15767.1 hypothetical protein HRM2_26730 [Desulforapulum autotrophicum HRM2]